MREQDVMCEQSPMTEALEKMGGALHDLCQPLTTLQCRLEIAGLVGTAEAFREAVELGLLECGRLAEGVHLMREILQASRRSDEFATGRSGQDLLG